MKKNKRFNKLLVLTTGMTGLIVGFNAINNTYSTSVFNELKAAEDLRSFPSNDGMMASSAISYNLDNSINIKGVIPKAINGRAVTQSGKNDIFVLTEQGYSFIDGYTGKVNWSHQMSQEVINGTVSVIYSNEFNVYIILSHHGGNYNFYYANSDTKQAGLIQGATYANSRVGYDFSTIVNGDGSGDVKLLLYYRGNTNGLNFLNDVPMQEITVKSNMTATVAKVNFSDDDIAHHPQHSADNRDRYMIGAQAFNHINIAGKNRADSGVTTYWYYPHLFEGIIYMSNKSARGGDLSKAELVGWSRPLLNQYFGSSGSTPEEIFNNLRKNPANQAFTAVDAGGYVSVLATNIFLLGDKFYYFNAEARDDNWSSGNGTLIHNKQQPGSPVNTIISITSSNYNGPKAEPNNPKTYQKVYTLIDKFGISYQIIAKAGREDQAISKKMVEEIFKPEVKDTNAWNGIGKKSETFVIPNKNTIINGAVSSSTSNNVYAFSTGKEKLWVSKTTNSSSYTWAYVSLPYSIKITKQKFSYKELLGDDVELESNRVEPFDDPEVIKQKMLGEWGNVIFQNYDQFDPDFKASAEIKIEGKIDYSVKEWIDFTFRVVVKGVETNEAFNIRIDGFGVKDNGGDQNGESSTDKDEKPAWLWGVIGGGIALAIIILAIIIFAIKNKKKNKEKNELTKKLNTKHEPKALGHRPGLGGNQGPGSRLGPNGHKVPNGRPGPMGPNGRPGPQGPHSRPGPQGPHGRSGLAGPNGRPGAQGPNGRPGPMGAGGPSGPASNLGKNNGGTMPGARAGNGAQKPGMNRPSSQIPPKININTPPKSLAPKKMG